MFYLNTFGGLSLTSDGDPPPVSATQRRRLALLAALACAGELGAARDKLVGLLWPDSPPDKARHALDQLLYATRRDLGRDAVRTVGPMVSLDARRVGSDLAEFENAIHAREWERAAALYAGPFLDGVYLDGAPEWERWTEAERDRLARRYAMALEREADARSAAGDHVRAAEAWRKLASQDRLSSRVALALMHALNAAGERAAAIRHAEVHAALLREELDAPPDPDVARFASQLVSAPPERKVGGGSSAPPPPPLGPDAAPRAELPSPAIAYPSGVGVRSGPAPVRAPSMLRRAGLVTAAAVAALLGVAGWAASARDAIPDTRAAARTPPAAIAVLPFTGMSPGSEAEYLSDGITEELIHTLSRIDGLQVVARTSAFAFKGKQTDVREIGNRLGVGAVLQGSIRKSGEQLRITVQLIDTESGFQLWSERYDRRLGDLFALQEEISGAVAQRLRPGALQPVHPPARSLAAYHLYLQGRFLLNQMTEPSLHQAVDRFNAAIRVDSGYAPAYAGLSDAYTGLVPFNTSAEGQHALLADAEAAVRRAIRLNPGLGEAHTSLGKLLVNRWDWKDAEWEFRRAIDVNPGLASAYAEYGVLLALLGRFDEGTRMVQRAQELDPLSLNIHGSAAYVLSLARRYDEAEPQVRTLIAMDSSRAGPHFRLGSILLQTGRYDEAARELRTAMRLSPAEERQRALPLLAYAYARDGYAAGAARLHREVERGVADHSVSGYFAAAYFGGIGQPDRAFDVLGKLAAQRNSCLQDLAVDPVMDPLRGDPRFQRIVEQIGTGSASVASESSLVRRRAAPI